MSEYTENVESNTTASVLKQQRDARGSRNPASRITLPRPDWLPESVWPFDTFGLEIDDSIVAVTDVGNGPVLLLVHCGLWSLVWRDLITRLASDFRCVAFDAPGTGRSTKLVCDALTVHRASRAVSAIIESL